ncbi:hypothetical protein ACFY7H_18535 [Streptomyces sp. NPDC012794]|uniref:hypothetical protein n=1 Tax=Streptomyces sp. NPDC012794 TaxID=3364850 RepID=UPI0036B02AEF
MRLRTTAVALVGALTLVLPTAGSALADDGGAFNYTFLQDGASTSGQVSDLTEGRCHVLAVTDGASIEEVVNETDMVALLFDNQHCKGRPVATAGPGEMAGDFKAVAVRFESAEQEQKREDAAEAPAQAPAESDESEAGDEEDDDYIESTFRRLG